RHPPRQGGTRRARARPGRPHRGMGAAVGLLIGDIVTTARLTAPEALAATLGPSRLTFAELDRQANRYANALAGLGLRHGDRLAWCAGPSLHVLPAFVAAAR